MGRFEEFGDNTNYDYEDLYEYNYKINKSIKEITRSKKAISIAEFFALNPEIEDNLRKTNVAGIPLNALLANYDVCINFCDSVSRLFAISSGIEGVKIATATDKLIAFYNFEDFKSDWKTAHHTWAEFKLNGKEYVADFTDQMVFNKEDYYKINYHEDGKILLQTVEQIALQQMINESHYALESRVRDIIFNQYALKQIDEFIEKYSQKKCKLEEFSKNYFVKEMKIFKDLLIRNGATEKTLSYTAMQGLFTYLALKSDYLLPNKFFVKKHQILNNHPVLFLNENTDVVAKKMGLNEQWVKDSLSIYSKCFTNEHEFKVKKSAIGPLEYINNQYLDLGMDT